MKARWLLFLLYAELVSAHDLWLEPISPDTTVVRYGHSGVTHQGERYLAYTANSVKEARCFINETIHNLSLSTSTPVQTAQNCDAHWVVFSTGFWSKTPQGTVNQAKNQLPAVYQSWFSQETVKQISRWTPTLARPLTQDFELVVEENPLLLQVGDKLRLRVFDQGRPVAGLTVAYFGEPRGITDEQGRINIRIQQSGLQLVQASKTEPYRDQTQADQLIQTTALEITIP